ncbi:hypothetical protein FVEG_01691 [Fusarium verticillioides 7600]|uniref:Uncharacterized protein n=1 Tax=Gibberella moniliformis (strain M3125 / FGSC 7600) TaxID=334819 RepID=W7LSL9_GIBM7|nr:hypothetical protein FVEG_01691 [Fusarium verticillioides 7600]EWG38489.1 hypothetical protein FVEG_01691 [Fusarium verticillioides 7600]
MFIYQGKLNWNKYAVDETITIVLPKGAVRANEPAYLFTQWTVDDHQGEKDKFYQTRIIKNVKQLPNTTDVSFKLPGTFYNYDVTTEQNYSKIKVTMSGRDGTKTITLDRVWQPVGEVDPNAALRIWAGSINLGDKAVNEQAIFVLPEDFKDGKPVISSWQWTKDESGKAKTTAFKGTSMKFISSENNVSKFAFNNVFDFTCSWDTTTQQLDVEVKDGGKQVNIGTLNLFAKIEAQAHHFDSDDLIPPTQQKTEFRVPQPQATLPRVLDPMPFPKTLFETLTHGAAFIEQAGYLTIQAQNKFTALHEEFHKQGTYVETLKKDKQNLEEQIKSISDARKTAEEKIKELEKQLAQASAEYQKKVKALTDFIEHLKKDDVIDHKTIKKLQEELNHVQQQIISLNGKLSQAQIEKKALGTVILGLKGKIAELDGKRIKLENELTGQKAQNVTLRGEIISLKRKLSDSLDANGHLQKELRLSKTALEETKKELNVAKDKFNKEELAHKTTKADLKTAKETADALNKELTAVKSTVAKAEKTAKDAEEDYDNKVIEARNFYHKIQKYEETVDVFQKILIKDDIENEGLNNVNKTFKELRRANYVCN